MAFRLGSISLNAVAQGVGGLVFGSGDKTAPDDGGVQRLLERIQHGVLQDDRRAAVSELQVVVAEDVSANLMVIRSFGFPVLMSIFREDREDIDMLRILCCGSGVLAEVVMLHVPSRRLGLDSIDRLGKNMVDKTAQKVLPDTLIPPPAEQGRETFQLLKKKIFNFPWEETMQTALKQGKALFLQNLDPCFFFY
ncbi:unnamed protein product [Calypogeia fissa]